MNNKLTLSDLASLLAERNDRSKSDIEKFLRELLNVVSEGLLTDKFVKIKGIGTFKIIPVERRESVDVNTGERFVIPEHYKYTYLPDKDIKELVNKPFSLFETTEITDEVSFSDVEEVEENGDLNPDDESVDEDSSGNTDDPGNKSCAQRKFEKTDIVVPSMENAILPEKEENESGLESGKSDIEEIQVVHADLADRKPVNIKDAPERISDRDKARSFYLKEIFYSVLILLGFGGIAYVIYWSYSQEPVLQTSELQTQIQQTEGPILTETKTEDSTLNIPFDRNEFTDTLLKEELQVPEEEKTVVSDTIIDRIKIEAGSRLTLISLKYYGDKLFWVYIYEANKEVIKNPNNVPVGTFINIPSPELYGIDAKDKTSLSKAAALQTEILKANP